jgi:hypothetical protein
MQCGMIGLGRMGANMARRLLRGGHTVVVTNRSPEPIQRLTAEGATGALSVSELLEQLERPRAIWISLRAGEVTEQTLQQLAPLSAPGRHHQGETEQRLFAVPVWRETPFFSPRERAALAWTEAVTEIGRSGVSDALYDEARAQFTEKELVDLTVAVIAINAWNRLAVTFRPAVGNYKPAVATTAASA